MSQDMHDALSLLAHRNMVAGIGHVVDFGNTFQLPCREVEFTKKMREEKAKKAKEAKTVS